MSNKHFTLSNKHFTLEERETLVILKAQNFSNSQIAIKLNKHRSSIGRELKRNSNGNIKEYSPSKAQEKYIERKSSANSGFKKITEETKYYIKSKLIEEWSPEQISGRMKYENIDSISHETIYKMIYENRETMGEHVKDLRRKRKKRRSRSLIKKTREIIKNRVGIENRGDTIGFGHWEMDTIIGKNNQGAIITCVDKKSKYLKADLTEKKKSDMVSKKIIKMFKDLPKEIKKTMTSDNGTEFAEHQEIVKELNVLWYFANPYHSWERGLNEHTNGLLRQYFPKKTDFTIITNNELQKVVDKINKRPRKSLDFLTPHEVLSKELKRIEDQDKIISEYLPVAFAS